MADILIIGAGVAGLSAGIYSALAGHHPILCEKNAVAGGNLTGWQRGAYHIDNCIHWLTGTNTATDTYAMWRELGALGGVEIVRHESLYTCEHGGRRLSLVRDLDALEREMLAVSPADKKEITLLFTAVRALQRALGIGYSGQCAPGRSSVGYGTPGSGTHCAVLHKIASLPSLARYYGMTTGELASRFKSELIRFFLTSFLTEDFASLALITVFAHFCADNADLPRAGSAAMAQRMEGRLRELGGEIRLGSAVRSINRDSSGLARSVTLADSTVLSADHVIITADPARVFGRLIDVPMPHSLQRLYKRPALSRFSCFQCAFSCPSDSVDFCSDIIFRLPSDIQGRLGSDRLIVREFSHERDFAPPGETVIQTMVFCDENCCREFIALRERRNEYDRVKRRLSAVVREALERRFPRMAGELRLIDSWTPATYRRYVGSEVGSFMGFAFGGFVLPRMESGEIEGVGNVTLATQWLQAPGGLPIAAQSGMRAAQRAAQQLA